MTRTASEPEDHEVASRSVGYLRPRGGGDWKPNTSTLPYCGTSAGGGYSTVDDLMRFATALMQHKLVDAEHTALLIDGKVDTLAAADVTHTDSRMSRRTASAP